MCVNVKKSLVACVCCFLRWYCFCFVPATKSLPGRNNITLEYGICPIDYEQTTFDFTTAFEIDLNQTQAYLFCAHIYRDI